MQKLLIILLVTCPSLFCYAQKNDYLNVRANNYLATCGSDSQATFKAREMLLRTDINSLNKNIDAYYNDLGLIYYKMSLHSRNKKYMDTAVRMYKKALNINATNKDVIWNCAIALIFSKPRHCKEGMKYVREYLRITPVQEADTESINGLCEVCQQKTP